MSAASRRFSFVAVVAMLALVLAGLPALASASEAPASAGGAVAAPVVTRTAGITQLSDSEYLESDPGAVLYDSRTQAKPLKAQERRTISVLGGSPVAAPADATAAILNVTAVSPTASGWLALWPADKSQPATSTVNFVPGTPTPNLAVVQLTAGRQLAIKNGSAGTTHVLVSLRGWIRSNNGTSLPGTVTPTDATRVIDTRTTGPAIPAQGYRDVKVTGVGAPDGAGAALLDVVAVTPRSAGYLIAHPSDTARPTSTMLTYRVGSSRAALSLVRLSAAGTVRLWNMSSTPVHLVVDSFGWVAAGDASPTPMGTSALTPDRVLDTRETTGALSSGNGYTADVPLPAAPDAARGFVPSGAVLAITATRATRSGYLDVDVAGDTTSGLELHTPSVLNFAAGETVTNTTYVTVPPAGRLRVHAGTTGSVHVVVDLVGLVSHRGEFRGRVVKEADGSPLYPSAAGDQLGYGQNRFVAPTAPDGTYRWGYNARSPYSSAGSAACATAMTTPGTVAPRDTTYAVGCTGGTVTWAYVQHLMGAAIDVGDVAVPRSGTLTGVVTRPQGSSTTTGSVFLKRTDGGYFITVPVAANGTWKAAGLPVGDWVVTAGNVGSTLRGEIIDEIPVEGSMTLTALAAANAKSFTVTAGAVATADEAQLKAPGRLNWTIVDPDGNYADVRYTVRHESGFTISESGATVTQVSRLLRPGGYTVCATEGAVTVCNGGASSADTAPLLQVTSSNTDPGVSTTITLP